MAQLVIGALILGPWVLILVYDVVLYLWRSIAYELPYVGGRYRGSQRPRAPSLKQRPDGHKRQISLPGVTRSRHGGDAPSHIKRRSTGLGPRTMYEHVVGE